MKLTTIGMLSLATLLSCANASNESAASPSAGNPTSQTTITGATVNGHGEQERAQAGGGKGISGVGDKSSVGVEPAGAPTPIPKFGVSVPPRPEPNPPPGCKPPCKE